MSRQRELMQHYFDALIKRGNFSHYFSEDIAVTVEGPGQRANGRAPAEQVIRFLHEKAFDARPEVRPARGPGQGSH